MMINEMEKTEEGFDYFRTLIIYTMSARKDIELTDVYEAIKAISLERSEEIMTIAEQLIREGVEKGMEILIQRMLTKGLCAEEIAKKTDLDISKIIAIEKDIMQ